MIKRSLLVLSAILVAGIAQADNSPLVDIRYCGTPARDATGEISRSASVIRAFRKQHPCPTTGKITGACAGWSIDHVVPLSCGGCDAVWNMQWLPNSIKSCAGTTCKDRWERKVYCGGK